MSRVAQTDLLLLTLPSLWGSYLSSLGLVLGIFEQGTVTPPAHGDVTVKQDGDKDLAQCPAFLPLFISWSGAGNRQGPPF